MFHNSSANNGLGSNDQASSYKRQHDPLYDPVSNVNYWRPGDGLPDHDLYIGFPRLFDDILLIIFEEIAKTAPSTMPSIALVNKHFNSISTPFIYRTVAIMPHSSYSQAFQQSHANQATECLLKRLVGKRAEYVRNLIIEDGTITADMTETLSCLRSLRTLEWNTSATIPPPILEMLQTKWPEAKLIVRNHNRNNVADTANWDLDETLLLSPNLDSLDIDILVKNCWNNTYQTTSEWPQLTYLLTHGCHPRALHVHVKDDAMRRDRLRRVNTLTYTDVALPRLQLSSSTRLPPLEELSIVSSVGGLEYNFDGQHCHLLSRCMDWAQMTKLGFGKQCPTHLFAELIGRVPRLKVLEFGFSYHNASCEPVYRFIHSIDGLEKLKVYKIRQHLKELWPAVKKHKDTLKTLTMDVLPQGPLQEDPSSALLKEMAEEVPHLEHIGFRIRFSREELSGGAEHMLRNPQLQDLAKMNLCTLDLLIHLPECKTVFADDYHQDAMGTVPFPNLDRNAMKKHAIQLADGLSTQRDRGELQGLRIFLSRTGYYDRAQAFLMGAEVQLQRNVRDDANSLGVKKWSVTGGAEWCETDY